MKRLLALLLAIYTLPGTAQNYSTLYKEGMKLIEEKEFAKAAHILEQALPLADGRTDFGLLVNLAYSQMMTGEYEKAAANYSKALELRPKENAVRFQRSGAYLQLGRLDDTIEECCGIINDIPDNTDALLMRAQAYTRKGEYSKAKEDLVRAITVAPTNTDARLGLVELYRKEQKYNEALVLTGLLIEEQPENATLYIVRSDMERELGQTELALMDVAKAIEIDPDNAGYYTLQAILYEECGKKSAAAKSRSKATALKTAEAR